MSPVREAWTDERLDDLVKKTDEGFREQREDTRTLRAEMNSRFNAIENRIDQRFNSLLATILAGFAAMIVTHFV